jgi:hypothetical protein
VGEQNASAAERGCPSSDGPIRSWHMDAAGMPSIVN